jgi:hypothetical protein
MFAFGVVPFNRDSGTDHGIPSPGCNTRWSRNISFSKPTIDNHAIMMASCLYGVFINVGELSH